jgi:hypothetical protein
MTASTAQLGQNAAGCGPALALSTGMILCGFPADRSVGAMSSGRRKPTMAPSTAGWHSVQAIAVQAIATMAWPRLGAILVTFAYDRPRLPETTSAGLLKHCERSGLNRRSLASKAREGSRAGVGFKSHRYRHRAAQTPDTPFRCDRGQPSNVWVLERIADGLGIPRAWLGVTTRG